MVGEPQDVRGCPLRFPFHDISWLAQDENRVKNVRGFSLSYTASRRDGKIWIACYEAFSMFHDNFFRPVWKRRLEDAVEDEVGSATA